MEEFKQTIRQYIDINKKLEDVNAAAKELRYERNTIELNLTALYSEQKDLPTNINLTSSNMVFRAKKPGDWKKGWSLSKKQLEAYLMEILGDVRGKETFDELVKRHEATLIADEYSYELKPSRE